MLVGQDYDPQQRVAVLGPRLDAVWDWNLRTGKLAWTPELEVLFGLQPGTVQRYADFRERVHPDDIAA